MSFVIVGSRHVIMGSRIPILDWSIMEASPRPRRRGYADTVTGEMFDLLVTQVPRPTHRQFGVFTMITNQVVDRASDALSDSDFKLLIRLATRMDDRNYLFLDLTTLAVEIKRTREYTSRAIARLVDHGMIHRGPKVGRSWTYRLDPHLGWRGDVDQRRKATKEAETRWFGAEQVPGQMELPQ